MSWLDLLVGSGPSQRVVIVGTVALYVALLVRRPEVARESARSGVGQFANLFTLIVAALLLASAIGTLLPEEAIVRYLGSGGGPANAVLAGLVGGALFGGPYGTYPIMRSVREQGAGYVALLSMYVGAALVIWAVVPERAAPTDERE
ncbi:MAG: hypothetical protein ABEJ31_05700 [Haloarculaceae archaeon]